MLISWKGTFPMRRLSGIALLGLLATTFVQAQLPPGDGFIKVVPGSTQSEQPANYSDTELDSLLKPLAMYPDPLLAQVLPAATRPDQVELAAQWLAANPQGDVDSQPWDEAVRAVAHYPPVLEMMSKDLAWTEAVGYAYTRQPAEVTASLQRVRGLAYDSGTLVSNDQQVVTRAQNYITILPVSPEVLYVPAYAVADVWTVSPSYWFGYRCGPWLSFGFNWLGGSCYRYPRGCYWGQDYSCYNNLTYINNTYCNQTYTPRPVRTNYNNCYRPGRNWDRQPSCNVNNWSQRLPMSRPVAGGNSGYAWSRQGQRDYRPGRSNWGQDGHRSGWTGQQGGQREGRSVGQRPDPSSPWNGGSGKPGISPGQEQGPRFSSSWRNRDNKPSFSMPSQGSESSPWRNRDNKPSFSMPSQGSESSPWRNRDNKPSFSMPSQGSESPWRNRDNKPSFSMPSQGSESPWRNRDSKPSFSMPSRGSESPWRNRDSKPSFSMPSRSYERPSFSMPSGGNRSNSGFSRPSFSSPTPNFNRPSFSRPSFSAPNVSSPRSNGGGGSPWGGGRRKNK